MYIAILFIIPGIIQFRNYQLTKSIEYLKFSSLFFLFVIENLIQSLDTPSLIIDMASTLTFSLVNYIIILIVSGVANNKLPIKEGFWKIGMIITYFASATIEILVYNNRLQFGYQNLHVLLLDAMTLFAGAMVVYAFVNTPYVLPGARTSQTIKIWILIGLLLIVIGSIRIWNNLDDVLKLLVNFQPRIGHILESTEFIEYLTIVIGLLALVLAFFYPETMLLSQTQIMKVAKLFRSSETQMLFNSNQLPVLIGKKQSFKKYMKDVAEIIKKENDINN